MGKKRKQKKGEAPIVSSMSQHDEMLEWATNLRSISKAINEFCDMIVDMGDVDPIKFTEVVKQIKFGIDNLPEDTENTLDNFYNDLEKAKEGRA